MSLDELLQFAAMLLPTFLLIGAVAASLLTVVGA
jgi:hypothetical protein